MAICYCCGKKAENCYSIKAHEILTLNIRGASGTKRVQAMGDVITETVCKDCASRSLTHFRKPGRKLLKAWLFSLITLSLGIAITITFWHSNGALRLLGIASIVSSLMIVYSKTRVALRTKNEFLLLSDEEALYRSAWECLNEVLPKKTGYNDISYLPVNARTLAMKEGDLMIEFKLLPEIAVQAYKRIRRR